MAFGRTAAVEVNDSIRMFEERSGKTVAAMLNMKRAEFLKERDVVLSAVTAQVVDVVGRMNRFYAESMRGEEEADG